MRILPNFLVCCDERCGSVSGGGDYQSVCGVFVKFAGQADRFDGDTVVDRYEANRVDVGDDVQPMLYIHRQSQSPALDEHGDFPGADGGHEDFSTCRLFVNRRAGFA